MNVIAPAGDRALYEADEHAWIARQIEALRSGRLHELDRGNLVEYLHDLTIRDRRELRCRLAVLLQHLLKVRMQPDRLSRGWILTIVNQQQQINGLLTSIPSLATSAQDFFIDAYADAIRLAAAETGIPAGNFPQSSPWTMQAALAFVPPDPPQPRWKRRSGGAAGTQ